MIGQDFESRLTRDVCTVVVSCTYIGSSDLNVLITCVCVRLHYGFFSHEAGAVTVTVTVTGIFMCA